MSVLLAAHLLHLEAAGRSPRTIHDRRRLLIALDRELPEGIDHATTDELAAWLARGGWARWTRCTYFRHIRGFYQWATCGREPRLDYNPAADLAKPRNPDADPHPATDDQLAAAMARSDDWWRRAIVLAAYAGLRAREIAQLRREDVTATDVRVVEGKGGKTAMLPCHDEIWARVGPLPPGLVLPGRFGQVVDHLPSRARSYFDRIGLPGLHLHMFRHWYCVRLLRAGVDIRTVQGLMRHTSLQTTAAYLPLVDGQRRNAIATLPVLHGPHESASSQQNAA